MDYPNSDIIGKDIRQITYSEDLGSTLQLINKIQNGELDGYKSKKRYVKSNGDLANVQVTLNTIRDEFRKLLYSVLMVQDLFSEEDSAKKLKFFEHSINNVSDMVSISDRDDKFIFVNKSFKKRYGYSEGDIIGKKSEVLRQCLQKNSEISENANEKRWDGDIINKTKFGEIFPVLCQNLDVKDGKGEIIGHIGITRDVTDQLKIEENMKQSESFVILGRMASYLSHEIKTPLTAIKLNIEMLTEKLKSEKVYSQSFQIINKEIQRLEKLLKDVLQFSKERENLFYDISLNELLHQLIDLLRPVLKKKNISIFNNIGPGLVKGDSSELKTMFHQLIENSIDAIDQDGRIEFRSVSDSSKKMLRIFVRDTGSGIKSSQNIFEPFFTTKQSGTGLGLSIVQKIIKKHQGAISLIFSEPGNTIFQISLPLS